MTQHNTLIPLLALAALVAGCASPAALESAAEAGAAARPPVPEPFHAEGTWWVEPSQSQSRSVHEIVFTANATGMIAKASVTVGERYGPVDLPTSIADWRVELRDAADEVLAETERAAGGPSQLTLEAEVAAGEGKLVFLVYGGSGGGMGDYGAWTLDVT